MSWFGWLLLAFSTFWVAGLVCIIFISIIPYCWGCLERRFCPERLKNSQNMFIKEALATKKVVRHDEILHNYCTVIENRTNDDEDEIKVSLINKAKDVDSSDEESNNGSTITDNDSSAHTCAICLEPFKIGDSVSWSKHLISCKHVFHNACISAWLTGRNDDCPCCRRNYFAPRKESAMYCFGSSDNDAVDNEANEVNAMKILNDGQFCVDHGLCLNPTVLSMDAPNRIEATAEA